MTKDRHDSSTDDFFLRYDINTIETEWVCPVELPDLRRYSQIAVDLETCDPNLTTKGPGWATGDGYIAGIAVAAGDFRGYFPIRHSNGPNLDRRMVLRWLSDQLDTPEITKVFHNAPYDIGWLRAEGVRVSGPVFDTMIAAPLIDENRLTYRLDALGKEYLAVRKDEKILRAGAAEWGVDPKAEMFKMPARFVGAYAEQDAVMTLQLKNHFETLLEKDDLWSIFRLEMRVQPALIDMRFKGVRIDLDAADRAKTLLQGRKRELKALVKAETGVDVEQWAAESVQKVFDHLGVPYTRTAAGQPSFTKGFLNAQEHPAIRAIVRLREADKADSTFIDSILKFNHNGRIHCELHQLRSDDGGTVTGRFSSSNPNLQQIPARDPEIRQLIRGIFVPEEGERWGSFDYASQEPRLLAHFAASMPEHMRHPMVDTLVEKYHAGDADLHQMVADMAGISRKQAKTINLGIMYGMGVAKLADQLGLSGEAAKALLADYHDKVPFVKRIAEAATRRAETAGQVRTVLGRLCHFHMWEPASFGYNKPLPLEEAQKTYGSLGQNLRRAFTYKALNRIIQGSAADQNKLAMAECYEAGLCPLLTVHDELCFSVGTDEQAARITEIMEQGLQLKVPSKVDIALESNWGLVE